MGNSCVRFRSEPQLDALKKQPTPFAKRNAIKTDFLELNQSEKTLQIKSKKQNGSSTKTEKGKSTLTLKLKTFNYDSRTSNGEDRKTIFFKKKTLQDFEVIRGLGKGGFGKVYLIRQKTTISGALKAERRIVNLQSNETMLEQSQIPQTVELTDLDVKKDKTMRSATDFRGYLHNNNNKNSNQNLKRNSYDKQENFNKTEPKHYALKIMDKDSFKSKRSKQQAKCQRTILQTVDHPFIVKLHYAFQTSSKLFLIVDLLEGGQLFYLLRKVGRFKEDIARFYAAEILLGIEYLHQKSIIYRDLKPENILLDKEGHIKITDFGLSKILKSNNIMTYTFCGTAQYIAPEVTTGKGYGQAADWFSFGSLLYDMLTGSPPFSSKNKKLILRKVANKAVPIPYYLSQQAKSLLNSLFKINPADRLGFKQGAAQIKKHSFFHGIDFDAIYQKKVKPPISFRNQSSQKQEKVIINNNGFEKWNSWRANIDSLGEQKIALQEYEGFTYGEDQFQLKDESDFQELLLAEGKEEINLI